MMSNERDTSRNYKQLNFGLNNNFVIVYGLCVLESSPKLPIILLFIILNCFHVVNKQLQIIVYFLTYRKCSLEIITVIL